jgi:enamine deaminase RidA (YjgF/YER057c/UK114 family)
VISNSVPSSFSYLQNMSSKSAVYTTEAPKPPAGVLSQAIKANGFVFVSGAVPMDPVSMKIVDGDVQAHTVREWPVERMRLRES